MSMNFLHILEVDTMRVDKADVMAWAREVLSHPVGEVLILDTETCALYGEVIELALVDVTGKEIYNRRFNPLSEIEPGAFRVHGISQAALANEPSFGAEYEAIKAVLASAKLILIYNAQFDIGCLEKTCRLHKLEPLYFVSDCLMERYAQFYGEWSSRRQSYKWQPLNGGHSALDDCRAALRRLQTMAGLTEGQAA